MKIKIEGEFTYNAELMHSGNKDKESKQWFYEDILKGETLMVFSPEIGDEIGTLRIKKLEDLSKSELER